VLKNPLPGAREAQNGFQGRDSTRVENIIGEHELASAILGPVP